MSLLSLSPSPLLRFNLTLSVPHLSDNLSGTFLQILRPLPKRNAHANQKKEQEQEQEEKIRV